jgi:hypothetical protein
MEENTDCLAFNDSIMMSYWSFGSGDFQPAQWPNLADSRPLE